MATASEITAGDAGARRARLEAAFAEEQLRGFALAARVRLVMIACIGIWITIENPFPDFLFFTTLAETMPPSAVIDMLRGFHGRMAGIVFAHHGTLEKYIGDALMATFGAPRAGPTDATDALRCARAMHAALAAWNAERGATGATPLHMGIGLNWGPVVIGDIGTEHSLAFAVVGDTVNATQRLERLTRELGGEVVASDAFIAAVRREGAADADALLQNFVSGAPQTLRGREAAMAVWVLS